MENKAHALLAGLFTLILGAAVIVAAMWFSGDTYEKAYYVLESRYPVTGLNKQAVVRYRGVDIGKVIGIEFDPNDRAVILIDIAIQREMPLTRSTYAELRYQGVTGLSYVMLDDPRTSTEVLRPANEEGSARIPIRESLFSSLAQSGQQVMTDAREVMKRVNSLLSDRNQEQIRRTLENVEIATRQITTLAQAIEPAARDSTQLIADARNTFQNADRLLNDLAATNRAFANKLEAVDRVAGSAEKAGGAVANLADSVASETLPRINALADDLARTSRSVERLAAQLKDQPQSLVFGHKPGTPGPGEPGFEPHRKSER